MARRQWVIDVLAMLGWTDYLEDGNRLIFNNPSKPDCPIGWNPDGTGYAIGPQLIVAGVSSEELERAIAATMPSTPYTSVQDF